MDYSFPFRASGPLDHALKDLKSKSPSFFETQGEKNALDLFRFAAKNVPAYARLLAEKKIDAREIKSVKDFQKLPVIDKESYLKKYPYEELFPEKDLSSITTISSTSGTTGEPFYIPRGEMQDLQYEYVAELFLKNQFELEHKRTLGIIGFGLGIWIGGIFTYKILNKIAAKGYKLSLIPVGSNKELYLKSLEKFAPFFDQVILMGYPPFIKDILDEAVDYGIHWEKYKIKILTATETFSEEFRDYLTQKAYIKNPLTDIINIYGTVELGTMAHETSLTTLIRKMAVQKEGVFQAIFPEASRLPTLAQYHPYLVYFEKVNGEVIGTGWGSSIPLIRYRFPDRGGVIPYDFMIEKLENAGIDILTKAKEKGVDANILHLPFVYVYERSDNAIIFRGANIYAEEIRNALLHESITKFVSGRCTLTKKEDEKLNEYMEIHIELARNIQQADGLKEKIQEIILVALRKNNSEYNDQYQSVPQQATPRIILWPYEDPTYFKREGKQKWVTSS